MAQYKYIVNKTDLTDMSFEEKDTVLVGPFSINNVFNSSKDFIDLHIYTLEGDLLKSQLNYKGASQSFLSSGAGKEGATNLEIKPSEDAVANGFENGEVKLVYNFFSDLFSDRKAPVKFFIEEISGDRTEIRLLSLEITDDELIQGVLNVKDKLENLSYFSEFKVNLGNNNILSGINIDSLSYKGNQSVLIKLYEPLPASSGIKDIVTLLEPIADSASFAVNVEYTEDKIKVPFLKGPNFEVELEKSADNPTEFFNYDELFSYPVTSSYYQLYSLFNEKGAQISVDHTNYADFIHFSSAEERLRNFKYKLDLIHSYEDSIATIESTGYQKLGASGSKDYYNGLIKGIVNNFDHYDRFLFYESGSYSWPKSNDRAPYLNQKSSTGEAGTWFTNQLVSASNFDITNYDVLTNTLPAYLREDNKNEPLLMFTHMLGQHFDNLWIYFKAVGNKYDADNRLNFGVSKDIVRSAVESFGVNIYNSNRNIENLFATFTGEGYNSGSTGETINNYMQITSGSGLEYLQPMPLENYQKEVYKRIYHNLPLISKAKGTHRGLRALINCFGIPDHILSIKQFGGTAVDSNRHFSVQQSVTSSLDKIRLDNTGSLVSGSTLSQYGSIVDKTYVYTDDVHTVEVGFDISDITNDLIFTALSGSFDYDDYIGDPGDRYESRYRALDVVSDKILKSDAGHPLEMWQNIIDYWNNVGFNWNDTPFEAFREPTDFVRLIKFFDNSIFRMVRDFIPARSNVNTGVIIKSHILDRSKAKQVEVSWENKIYTGSINIDPITGSSAGAFDMTPKVPFTTSYSASFMSPLGLVPDNVLAEEPRYTGEFSGSLLIATDGEMNKANKFKNQAQPLALFNLRAFNFSLPIPLACDVILDVTFVGEFYKFTPVGAGTVNITYPTVEAASSTTISQSVDYDTYQFINSVASPTYPYYFEGWYDGPDDTTDTLLQTGSSLTIYKTSYTTIDHFYAHFSTDPADRVNYHITTNIDGVLGDTELGNYGITDSVSMTYPVTVDSTGSFNHTQNWNLYGTFVVEAIDGYNTSPFLGWYDSSNNLLTTGSSLTVTSGSYDGGTTFYAKFD